MTLIETLRARALTAMKAKDSVATTILRLAQSEVQALEARVGRVLTDDEAFGALRKLVKSNEETLAASTGDAEKSAILKREIELLTDLLPTSLSAEAIATALAPVAAAIQAAANDGQATGVAMKHLKAQGAQVAGTDVAVAVKAIRTASV
ncbi:hypothetical protein BH09MYX1_BH09MYX1_22920 [soil metagenome]